MGIDQRLLIPVKAKGSRRYVTATQTFATDPVTLGAGDWWIAFACYHRGVTETTRIVASGAANDTADGIRVTYNATNRLIFAVSDGSDRLGNTLDHSSVPANQWNWVVWNFNNASTSDVYVNNMATAVSSEDLSSLGSVGYTHASLLIGAFSTDALVGSRIARVCIGVGGVWDETARNDWKNNAGRWSALAAGTKANAVRYYMCDESSGDLIDSTGTDNGTETNGPIPSAKGP